jgi:hypothetical protein
MEVEEGNTARNSDILQNKSERVIQVCKEISGGSDGETEREEVSG